MSEDNEYEKCNSVRELHDKAIEFRGVFLNRVACIEKKVSEIISEYFFVHDDDKKTLFFKKVMPMINLGKKKDILIQIVKTDYPQYWKEYESTFYDIQKISEFRNALAHSVIDTSPEALEYSIEKGVSFVQWNDGEPITDEEFNDWLVRATMLSGSLCDIERILPFVQKSET